MTHPLQIGETLEMGMVRVDVVLTNSVDESNATHNIITTDQIRRCTANALVDTGSACTVVPQEVVDTLGLDIKGTRVAEYADGSKERVNVVGPLSLDIDGRWTIEEALVLGDEVLIGQTVLEKMDLMVDCLRRRLVPNPAHPDYPVLIVKSVQRSNGKECIGED